MDIDPRSPPSLVTVVVETPKGSFRKSNGRTGFDFFSPIPCPFNYGSVPGTLAADGEPFDALILGPRLARGTSRTVGVVGVVSFLDAGTRDDKLVCGTVEELARFITRASIRSFFTVFALAKRLPGLRDGRGPTRYEGLRVFAEED